MKRFKLTALMLATTLLAGAAAPSGQADVVIKGGTIYDGGTGKPFVGDVAIKGDRILYVGPHSPLRAAQTVDAKGMIVSPGLIDAHSHPDTYILSPDAAVRVNAPWTRQGVSTILVGVDGYGTPDIADYAAQRSKAGVGTNLVPMIGFGAVRQRVLGQDARAPDAAELGRMKALVAKGMCEGAVGLSTGLFYPPQSFAKTEEVIAVAREAAIRGGLYDTHQRDESSYTIGLKGSVQEVLRIGREAGMPVHFAHIKALGVDVQGQAPQVIAMIEAARKAGQDVTADQYPWLASGSSLEASLLPGWSVDGGPKKMLERFADAATMARIRAEMDKNMRRRGGPGKMLLISAGFDWTGKTLEQMAAAWHLDPLDAALKIITQDANSDDRHYGGAIASFNMIDADVDLFMKQPWVVTSSDGSDGHPRQFATFPEKYAQYVQKRHVIDLASFIRQSTGRTADIYRLDHRGYLRSGYYADVAVIDPAHYAPRADYVHPRELSVGVRQLYVNGRLTVESDANTGTLAGRVLLRPAPKACPAH
jgi:N-acyl-D-aspartate/D-glutamate deacylase